MHIQALALFIQQTMEAIQILLLITSLFLLWSITKWLTKPSGKPKNFPPSPPTLPIIGNFHQLGQLPHRNLHLLAGKYGPLMLLHFGSVPVVVASSAEAAREIMKTHDLNFGSRPVYKAYKKLLYDCKNVSAAPYGESWRKAKGIFVLQLLSNKRVQSYRWIREEETALLVKKIEECCSSSSSGGGRAAAPVNLTRLFSELSVAGICRSAFGESENGKKFVESMTELMEQLGTINVGDFIPWLSWISRVNGFDKRVERVAKDMDYFLEGVIQEHLENPEKAGNNSESFVHILLRNYSSDASSIDRERIKALVQDVVVGGTDTISSVLEWVMTELLRHPNVMEKLQNEVREIVGGKSIVTDDDLAKMDYMKAVIKETFRYHMPAPMLLPRVADKDVKIMGYDISAGTMVMTNAWAIGRDPDLWDEPEKFDPERFLNNTKNKSMDFRGLDFELIPFGAGRRGCPGISFAAATIEFVLANLMLKFNWETQGKDLDNTESSGLTAHRATPLFAVATRSI
ncbi:PREDICTED: cytochrome P450 71A8-like [Erythranthe guttata]|nr:PREDICTED: cytochrome P450 71A8-like [Erythranthe guttata]|eukprot:XP_012829348.1 PREDICTED: cytochrome P450 71A8-like [Erythranthe guttata]